MFKLHLKLQIPITVYFITIFMLQILHLIDLAPNFSFQNSGSGI